MSEVENGTLSGVRPLLRVDGVAAQPYVLVWQLPRRGHRSRGRILGFVADLSFLERLVARVVDESPLLPPSLAGGDMRQLLSARVTTADGAPVFQSSAEWSEYTSEHTLDPELASLRVAVALQPGAAAALIIGGLPGNRLPLLAGLVLLTTVLVVVGAVQLRREHELARLRADFISGVSHELRTPLAQIRMFGETLLLERVRTADERQRSLAIIVQEAQRLTHLIENVLQFSRSERVRPTLSMTPCAVDVLLQSIAQGFEPLTRTRRATVALRVEPGLTAPLDAGAFRQIMLNLLDNAVKYGPVDQTITVTATLEGGTARVTVDDQGPGIAPEHRPRIWEPFHRLAHRSGETGGTGIGLAIVRELVTLHGGRVWVEAAPTAGARFVIEMPNATRVDASAHWEHVAASA